MASPTRRQLLSSVGAGLTALTAGCSFRVPDPPRSHTETATKTSRRRRTDKEFPDEVRERALETGTTVQDAVVEVSTLGKNLGGQGTGWFVDDSHVLTNAHVLEGYTETENARIGIQTWETETQNTELLGQKNGTDSDGYDVDLALIEVDIEAPATLSFGKTTELHEQQPLVQVGHPAYFEDWMIALGRFARSGRGGTMAAEIPIENGNSGSPLTTLDGDVVGIATETVGRTVRATEEDETEPKVWTEYPFQEETLVRGMGSFAMREYYEKWK